ncbi:MAG: cyclic-di-AMP receptor [Bacteroidota bacterium]
MKMMIVIVRDQDADQLTQKITAGNLRVTRVASTGGLLRSGVVTLLIGLENEQVDRTVELIRAGLAPAQERRATIFVVPVDRFEQI